MIIFSQLWREYVNGKMRVNPSGLAKHVAQEAEDLANYGCRAILWPPLTMAQGGTADDADGYGMARSLDTGQFAGRPTRWGTAQEVQAANRKVHAVGMWAFEDAVIHQFAGALPIYELNPDGAADHTLFPKMPSCFVPQVAADNVFDAEGNQAFGQMVSYQNSRPAGYMLHGMIQAMQWRKTRLGLNGGRLDDTKGEAASVSQRMIERVGGWWFGECFVGSYPELREWIIAAGYKRTLDFQLHWWIKAVCEGTASCSILTGFMQASDIWQYLVLFVESADTDNNDGENVRFNKMWGYLIILTFPAAAASIYRGDWEKYGLAPEIKPLMWVHETFAFGGLHFHHVEDDAIAWGRDGNGGEVGWSGGLLCAFARQDRGFWTPTVFRPNVHLHEYLGHGPDLWTDQNGWVYLDLKQGQYVAYAVAGVNRALPIVPIAETMNGSLFDFADITVRYSA